MIASAAVRGLLDGRRLDMAERGLDALRQDEVIPLRAVVRGLGANAIPLDLRNVPVERALDTAFASAGASAEHLLDGRTILEQVDQLRLAGASRLAAMRSGGCGSSEMPLLLRRLSGTTFAALRRSWRPSDRQEMASCGTVEAPMAQHNLGSSKSGPALTQLAVEPARGDTVAAMGQTYANADQGRSTDSSGAVWKPGVHGYRRNNEYR